MKIITLVLLALTLTAAVSKRASAQVNFTYAYLDGGFIDGEPDPTYTSSGIPPMASVQVGATVDFSVHNIQSVTETARTQLSCYCGITNLGIGGWPDILTSGIVYFPTTGFYTQNILGGQTYSSYGANCSVIGNVAQWLGNDYYAVALFVIQDMKTGDLGQWSPTSLPVQVN